MFGFLSYRFTLTLQVRSSQASAKLAEESAASRDEMHKQEVSLLRSVNQSIDAQLYNQAVFSLLPLLARLLALQFTIIGKSLSWWVVVFQACELVDQSIANFNLSINIQNLFRLQACDKG